ncbi:hypothetical protein WCP94_000525 (plasmid) [Bilophila wadsworthia]
MFGLARFTSHPAGPSDPPTVAVSPDGSVRGNPIMLHLQAKRKIPLGRNRRGLVFGPSGGEGFLSAPP